MAKSRATATDRRPGQARKVQLSKKGSKSIPFGTAGRTVGQRDGANVAYRDPAIQLDELTSTLERVIVTLDRLERGLVARQPNPDPRSDPGARLFEEATDSLVTGVGLSDGMRRQIERSARRLEQVRQEFGLLTSDQVADLAGMETKNRSATPTRWARTGKVIAVAIRGTNLYPGFQFDDVGQPLPVIKELTDVLSAYNSPVATVQWLVGRNGYLDGRRPVDLLRTTPGLVVEAARYLVDDANGLP